MATGARSDHVARARHLRASGATWSEIGETLTRLFDLRMLAALRLAHGWTQEQVADAWTDRWPHDRLTVNRLSSWECWPASGNPPALPDLVRLAELYQCGVTHLVSGLGDFAHLDTYPGGVNRRDFITASSVLAASALLPTTGSTSRRVGTSDVLRLRGEIRTLFELDDAQGGASVHERALQQLAMVRQLLDSASYGPTVGRDLQIVAGELTEMAGWSAFDSDQQADGRRLFTEALTAAQVTESARLTVLVMASMSLQSSSFGSGREAVELAESAQRHARSFASERLLSLLSAREALGHAKAGDAKAADASFARSEQLLDQDDEPGEEWLSFWGPADFHGAVGLARLRLGDPRSAERSCRAAIAATPDQYPRNRALYTGQLAQALLDQNDVDEAAKMATTAATGVCSGRLRSQMRSMRPLFQRHAGRPAVDRCLTRLAAVA